MKFMDLLQINLADLIQRLQASGLTQTEIGVAIGCSQSVISDISNGKLGKTRPSYKVTSGLIALAETRGLRAKQTKTTYRRRAGDKAKNKRTKAH